MTPVPARITDIVRSLTGLDLASVRAWWTSATNQGSAAPGPRANRRLTALTGAVVLPLSALVLLTGLLLGSLWHVHYFLAYLLLPVVLVKISSTGYRMVRYYLRSGAYRWIRPPYPLARLTSPLLVLSVVLLFVSGIAMWVTHTQRDPWGWLHTDAAIAFSVLVALHLGLYLPEALSAVRDDLRSPALAQPLRRPRRRLVVGAALLIGLVLALSTLPLSQFPVRAHRARRHRTAAGAIVDAPIGIEHRP